MVTALVFGADLFLGPVLVAIAIAIFKAADQSAAGAFIAGQVLIYLNTCDQPPADLTLTLDGPLRRC
jgi:hypothetical protein